MTVAKNYGIAFKQNWRDHTLTEKTSGEYIMWAHFQPDIGQVTISLSEKNIPMVTTFLQDFQSKLDDMLNITAYGKGKGKEKKAQADHRGMEIDQGSMPFNQSSHAKSARIPICAQHRCDQRLGGPLGGVEQGLGGRHKVSQFALRHR